MKTVCSPELVNMILGSTYQLKQWFDRVFNFCTFCMGHEEGYTDACHELEELMEAANV